jgi:heat shock protein HslJ
MSRSKVIRAALVVGFIALAAGLALAIPRAEPTPVGLQGTWVLICYGDPPKMRMPYPDTWLRTRGIGIRLTFGDSMISGFAGVNRYWANYELDGDELALYSEFAGERRECALLQTLAGEPRHLEAQEKRYLSLLGSAGTYEIRGRLLIVSSQDGILMFARSIRS